MALACFCLASDWELENMELALIALENALAAARPEPPRSSARYIVEQSKAVSDDGFRAALESANARAASTESASHCVEQGDTLWEICRDALQDYSKYLAPVGSMISTVTNISKLDCSTCLELPLKKVPSSGISAR